MLILDLETRTLSDDGKVQEAWRQTFRNNLPRIHNLCNEVIINKLGKTTL